MRPSLQPDHRIQQNRGGGALPWPGRGLAATGKLSALPGHSATVFQNKVTALAARLRYGIPDFKMGKVCASTDRVKANGKPSEGVMFQRRRDGG